METLFNKPLLNEQRMDAAHTFFVSVSDLLHQNRNCSVFALRRGVAVGVLRYLHTKVERSTEVGRSKG